jgi:hypothetical protein
LQGLLSERNVVRKQRRCLWLREAAESALGGWNGSRPSAAAAHALEGGEDTEEVAAWFPGGGLGLAGEDGRPPPPAAAAYDTVCRKQPFRHLLLSLSTRRVVKNLSNLELLVLPPCVTV